MSTALTQLAKPSKDAPCQKPPFEETAQLNGDIWLDQDCQPAERPRLRATPNKLGDECVPDWPLLRINDSAALCSFMTGDLLHHNINSLYPLLRLTSTPGSDHIRSLHYQNSIGRTVIVCEDPALHLLCDDNHIYIKPLPKYLTNYAFWKHYFCAPFDISQGEQLRASALGFVRTYAHLIRSTLDFNEAIRLKLVDNTVDFGALLRFLNTFAAVADDDVTPRYRFGELRLGRVNLVNIFRFRRYYHRRITQPGHYLYKLSVPFIFIFALLSVILSATQVGVAVGQLGQQAVSGS